MTNLLDCFSVKSLRITPLCHCVAERVIPIVVLETIIVAFVVVLVAFVVVVVVFVVVVVAFVVLIDFALKFPLMQLILPLCQKYFTRNRLQKHFFFYENCLSEREKKTRIFYCKNYPFLNNAKSLISF